jgi:hypothetical protein
VRARQNLSKTDSPAGSRDDCAKAFPHPTDEFKTVSACSIDGNGNGNWFFLILEMMSLRQHQRILSD